MPVFHHFYKLSIEHILTKKSQYFRITNLYHTTEKGKLHTTDLQESVVYKHNNVLHAPHHCGPKHCRQKSKLQLKRTGGISMNKTPFLASWNCQSNIINTYWQRVCLINKMKCLNNVNKIKKINGRVLFLKMQVKTTTYKHSCIYAAYESTWQNTHLQTKLFSLIFIVTLQFFNFHVLIKWSINISTTFNIKLKIC